MLVLGVLKVVVTVICLHPRDAEGQSEDIDGRLVEKLLVGAVLINQLNDLFVIHIFSMFTVSGLLFYK